jgi:hypothetical protein
MVKGSHYQLCDDQEEVITPFYNIKCKRSRDQCDFIFNMDKRSDGYEEKMNLLKGLNEINSYKKTDLSTDYE